MGAIFFIFPVALYLTITNVWNKNEHLGIDFGWNSCAPGSKTQNILACGGGKVLKVLISSLNTYDLFKQTGDKKYRVYGTYVIIDHENGYYSVYAHLSTVNVKVGDRVTMGQIIGGMGDTGYSGGPHLHFELRKGRNAKSNTIDAVSEGLLYVIPSLANPTISAATAQKSLIKTSSLVTTVGEPVARDTSRAQVELTSDTVNGRLYAAGNKYNKYVKKGVYNVLDYLDNTSTDFDCTGWVKVMEDADGQGNALWFAFDERWAIWYAAEGTDNTEELKAQIKQLNAEIDSLEDKNADLESESVSLIERNAAFYKALKEVEQTASAAVKGA